MSGIFVHGFGAVSPAGWGVAALREALARGEPVAAKELTRPGWTRPLRVRAVPPPAARPAFSNHSRLRRASPIAHYAVAAGLEALGEQAGQVGAGTLRLGLVFCAMAGSVNYSRRFYDETLKDPATASPLVFPETVFNAPASHLAALLGTTAINYTLVGDPGTYLQGLAVAGEWLLNERVDRCLVIGAEELDWLISDALHLFDRNGVVSEGAGAVCLGREPGRDYNIQLCAVTEPHLFSNRQPRLQAALRARAELGTNGANCLLADGTQGVLRLDRDETMAWRDWPGPRVSPKAICGEAFMASAAWQCVAALDELARGACEAAYVSVVGCNEQAIAARFAAGQPPVSN